MTKKTAEKNAFAVGEYVVYPAHGVGQILNIEVQEIAGMKLELIVVHFEKEKMTLRVPTSKIISVGMRKLADEDILSKVASTLSGRARVKRVMWSRRAQEYEAKINSGDLVSLAEVLRDLYRAENQPEQSYSERQLYEAAMDRMVREVSLSKAIMDTEALTFVETALKKAPKRAKVEEIVPEAVEPDEFDLIGEAKTAAA